MTENGAIALRRVRGWISPVGGATTRCASDAEGCFLSALPWAVGAGEGGAAVALSSLVLSFLSVHIPTVHFLVLGLPCTSVHMRSHWHSGLRVHSDSSVVR